MRKLFTLFIAVTAALGLALGGVAFADGPSGSTEHHEDEEGNDVFTNDVECDGGEATPVGHVYAADNGVEVCNDGQGGEVTPVQGRIIVTNEDGGYIAADGDKDNVFAGDDTFTGYIRIDGDGIHCSGPDDTSAPHSGTPGDGSTCGS